MANIIAPLGFRPIRSVGIYTGQTNTYYIPSTDTSEYSIGDAVKSAAGGDANGIPAIQKSAGTAAEYQRGVIVAVLPVPALGTPSLIGTPLTLETINIPASKSRAYYVMVCDDPQQLYTIQDDGSAALTATNCNNNALFTPTNPTTPLQVSATTLAASTVATTANFPLKMMGLYQSLAPGGGNTFGVYATWIVKFNLHEMCGAGIAGV